MGKILIVHHTASLGGASKALLEFAKILRSNGWVRKVLLPGEGPLSEEFERYGIPYETIPIMTIYHTTHRPRSSPWIYLPRLVWRGCLHTWAFIRLLRQWRPDVVWINSSTLLYSGILAKLLGFPAILWIRECIADKPPILKSLFRYLIQKYFDKVFFVSRFARDHLQNGKGPINSGLLYPLPRESLSSSAKKRDATLSTLNLSPSDKVLGVFGLIHPDKGYAQLVQALFILADEMPDLKIMAVGSGDLMGKKDTPTERSLRKLIHELKLHDRFILAGFQDNVETFLAVTDCVILPSVQPDALSLSILEAVMMEKPVIVSKWAGVSEFITNESNGYIIDPRNPYEIAAAIRKVFGDPSRCGEMGRHAKATVGKLFSEYRSQMGSRLSEYLSEVVDG